MTVQEEAKELLDKMLYCYQGHIDKYTAKQCALIAIDEIINHHSQEQGLYRIDTYYWQEVKQELLKL